MGIKRTEHPDGRWTEEADDPKSARELLEKHGPGLQAYGAQKFHESYVRDLNVGFERVRAPDGSVTHVRADEVDRSLSSGYSAVGNPTMRMPDVPWPRKSAGPGRHKFRYNKLTGEMEEVS